MAQSDETVSDTEAVFSMIAFLVVLFGTLCFIVAIFVYWARCLGTMSRSPDAPSCGYYAPPQNYAPPAGPQQPRYVGPAV